MPPQARGKTQKKAKIKKLPRIHKRDKERYIYIYDKEWLKTVLKQQCPSCNEHITKKGIKRECTLNRNHLEVYGDPIKVAYDRQIQGTTPIIWYDICIECGSSKLIDDPDRGEIICGSCGLLLSGNDPCVDYPFKEGYYIFNSF